MVSLFYSHYMVKSVFTSGKISKNIVFSILSSLTVLYCFHIKSASITNPIEWTTLILPQCAEVPNLHTICGCTGEEEVIWIRCLRAEHGALWNIYKNLKWPVSTYLTEIHCKSATLIVRHWKTFFFSLCILYWQMLWLLFQVALFLP